jgi:hypothetical protein
VRNGYCVRRSGFIPMVLQSCITGFIISKDSDGNLISVAIFLITVAGETKTVISATKRSSSSEFYILIKRRFVFIIRFAFDSKSALFPAMMDGPDPSKFTWNTPPGSIFIYLSRQNML